MINQKIGTSYFDIVDNRICPFCNGAISYNASDFIFEQAYCPDQHIKVMYAKNDKKWTLIRVYLNLSRSRQGSLRIDRDIKPVIMMLDVFGKDYLRIPLFDIFSYSLDELKNKIKLYTLFS
jgi:hypothetical protein